MRRRVPGAVFRRALTALLVVSGRREPGSAVLGRAAFSVLGVGLLGLGAVLAVTGGSILSHFEIRSVLNFIASSVARRLLRRVRDSERTPLSHRFLLT